MKLFIGIIIIAIILAIILWAKNDVNTQNTNEQLDSNSIEDNTVEDSVKWIPEKIKFAVKRDDEYLKKGQYLHLTQDVEDGWAMSKFDIPENWAIKEIKFIDADIVIELDNGNMFAINTINFGKLSAEILNCGPAIGMPEEKTLNEIWISHASYKVN